MIVNNFIYLFISVFDEVAVGIVFKIINFNQVVGVIHFTVPKERKYIAVVKGSYHAINIVLYVFIIINTESKQIYRIRAERKKEKNGDKASNGKAWRRFGALLITF